MTVVAPLWQRLEGLGLLVLSVLAYARFGEGWLLFALLFLLPDLSFLGYLAGSRFGAWMYNAAHSLLGPLMLALVGGLSELDRVIALALIWLAHIGFDRALGYGLKSPDSLGITHLGRIGKARQAQRSAV